MIDQMRQTLKQLRKTTTELSLRRLSRLDHSDQMMIAKEIQAITRRLKRIDHISRAGCSIVIEVLEHYTGHSIDE